MKRQKLVWQKVRIENETTNYIERKIVRYHHSWNISEGEEELKSRQILAVGCTKKTGKTREILKSM